MDFFNEIMKFSDIFESQETIDELKDFLRRWCQKAYINTGTLRKGMSIYFGTV